MKRLLKSERVRIIGSLLLAILLVTLVLFGFGVRVGSFGIGLVGSVHIPSDVPLEVVVDGRLARPTYTDGVVVVSSITPVEHEIILAPEDDSAWPWARTIAMTSGKALELNPLFVPKEPKITILTTKDQLYYTLPTFVAKNLSTIKSDTGAISISGGSIVRTSDAGVVTLFAKGAASVRAIVPYQGRTDTIIIAAGDGVYVLDISGETPQNFAPLYRGVMPRIASGEDRTIYILDGAYRMVLTY